MNKNYLLMLSGIQPDEMAFLEDITQGMPEDKQQLFVSIYATRRKTADTIMILTLLGFVGFSGIQRFVLGQIGMGILYFLTGGLCLVGTIVDLINHKAMTFEYNVQQAQETIRMIR